MRIDESFARSLMLFCFGAAGLLFFARGQAPASLSMKPKTQASPILSVSSASLEKVSAATANGSRLVVDLSDRRVYLYRTTQQIASYPLAVGQRGWETPTGNFKVLQMNRQPRWRHPITGEVIESGPDNPLGDRWIGFWTQGSYQIGFHGTNQESLIGKAISHGCLRMRNQDIKVLYEQVGISTPVTVRP